ncbi:MAG: hypothetical protein QHH10_10955 [Peptococcaceae bacterium]|jgi:hypothetical protein|nr:hypothetical protein [Peptococcaceae bacterium]MDH7525818.1 hypothetical protein [Peptococcaceae bacterium]
MVGKFFRTKRGSIIENIIYLIIIGALSFTFYSTKFKTPMESQMNSLNEKIQTWTSSE